VFDYKFIIYIYKSFKTTFLSGPFASGCDRHFFPLLDQTISSQSDPAGHLRDSGAQKLVANLDHGGAKTGIPGRTDAFTGGCMRQVRSTHEQFEPASLINPGRNRDSAVGGIISRPSAEIRKLPLGRR
jgi:hypothetical protein